MSKSFRNNSEHVKIKYSVFNIFVLIGRSLVRKRSTVRSCSWAPLLHILRRFLPFSNKTNQGKSSLGEINLLGTNSGQKDAIDSYGVVQHVRPLKGLDLYSLSQSISKKTSLGEGYRGVRGNGTS